MPAGLRIGLLGAGRIGARHAASLAGTEGVAEVVVADADPDRAAAVARETGTRAARSVDEVFAPPVVDAVVVATPTATHAALVGRAARAGLPAFCEKPLAPDVAGTEAALRAAGAAGTLLQIGFQRRFDAGFLAARRALRSGALGRVHTIRCVTSDAAPPPAEFLARSGGLIHDCMIHDFDAVRWLTGREVVEVYARGSDAGGPLYREAGDVDTACALLTLDDGTLVTVTATRCNGAGYDVRTELSGERDQWAAGLDARTPLTSAEPGPATPPERPWTDCLERFADAYRAELAAFVRAVRGEAPNPCPGVEGLHALRIAVACETSRREGRAVRVGGGA